MSPEPGDSTLESHGFRISGYHAAGDGAIIDVYDGRKIGLGSISRGGKGHGKRRQVEFTSWAVLPLLPRTCENRSRDSRLAIYRSILEASLYRTQKRKLSRWLFLFR